MDDEERICDLVSTALRYEGYETMSASNGRQALNAIAEAPPDLVILDVMLPDINGLEVTKRIRSARVSCPVLFLTARDATEDKVAGLTVGGDDYLTKPFSLEELAARTRAILRRTANATGDGRRLSYADLVLDEDTLEVWRNGQPVRLSATELNLLHFFLSNPRRVLSKAQILDHVWSYDFGGDANVVETYVSYLRKKLDPLGPPLIHTVRGMGYALRLPS